MPDELTRLKNAIIRSGMVGKKHTQRYSKIIFALPVPRSKITRFGSNIPPSHVGKLKNSIDFVVPKGTEVYAAADGVVHSVKSDSDVGGGDLKYWYDGNFVNIKHSDKVYTWYEHLKFGGVVVKPGQLVKKRQLIGYSGDTGFMFTLGPHLHFEVQEYYGNDPEDYVTLRARFEDFPNVYESE